MRELLREDLAELVSLLAQQGVRFPPRYLPDNLPEHSVHFRSRTSEILTTGLLAQVFPPSLIEIPRPDAKGDTDIFVDTNPPHRFQVKSPLLNEFGGGTIGELVRSARAHAWDEITAHRRDRAAFSILKVHLNSAGIPAMTGNTWTVPHQRAVHAAVVEVDRRLLEPMMKRKIRRWLDRTMKQLAGYEDTILVPTVDLSWHPVDQRLVYTFTRDLFKNHPAWTKPSGVLYLMRGYPTTQLDDGFVESLPRLIGVENPNAPSQRRLDPTKFNRKFLDESLFAETLVIISVDPEIDPLEIRNRILYVGATPFGAVPRGLAGPFMAE